MGKRIVSLLVLACAVTFLTSCADGRATTPTAPGNELTVATEQSRGDNRAGGKGSPHFAEDFVFCDFDTSTGHMVCDYQVAGLGKNGHAVITLEGIETLQYRCSIFTINTVRFFAQLDIWGDASGNYKGTIDAAPVAGPLCNNDVLWGLTDGWALTGLVDTKGGHTVPILYVQPAG